MFIDINTIGRDVVSFDRDLRLPDLEGPGGETVRVLASRLAGTVARGGRGPELNGHLDARLEIPCSRCLEPFDLGVATDVYLVLVPKEEDDEEPAPRPVAVADDEDDLDLMECPGGRLKLEDVVTEQLYLNLPLKPLCKEACRGLCPQCGANRNEGSCGCVSETVDPRLAPLIEFKRRRERS